LVLLPFVIVYGNRRQPAIREAEAQEAGPGGSD